MFLKIRYASAFATRRAIGAKGVANSNHCPGQFETERFQVIAHIRHIRLSQFVNGVLLSEGSDQLCVAEELARPVRICPGPQPIAGLGARTARNLDLGDDLDDPLL